MDFITSFFGRFHPLMVHLPIGIFFLCFFFECLAFREKFKVLRKAVQPSLLLGSIFAIAAAVTGFFLRQEGGYDETLADRHQNFGIITAVLSLIVYVVRPKVKYWVDYPPRRKQVKLALSVPLILSLIITGHWGGSLTHGEDYLFATVAIGAGERADPAEKIRTLQNVEQAALYEGVIQPILEARCYDCHSSSKQKGDLRLDKQEFIARGGKNGLVIRDGPADSSSLYKRLILPLEHDDHMPPSEKPQLSSSEIALIQYWIEGNADFEKSVADFKNHEKITAIVKAMQQAPQESWMPGEPVGAASDQKLQALADLGITPMPMAENNNHLMVTFAGHQKITDEQIGSLRQIGEQLVWLNLSYTAVTDQQMEAISVLPNLRVLYLNNTGISDAGLAKLATLPELRWLSLVGTRISDESIPTIAQLKKINSLFLFQTNFTEEGIMKLRGLNEEIKVDTGNYMLEKLPSDTIVYKKSS